MSKEADLLKLVARRLDRAGIPYMVSGSTAMNFYAQPRFTRDIDVIVELMPRDARRLRDLFGEDFYIDEEDVLEAAARRDSFNAIHNASMIKVDFIVRKDGAYRKLEFGRRRTISTEGCDISVVSPEDLILSKLCWAKEGESELQMRDVRNLLASRPDLDKAYLERWAADLGVGGLLITSLGGKA
jgi:hypothetical protein